MLMVLARTKTCPRRAERRNLLRSARFSFSFVSPLNTSGVPSPRNPNSMIINSISNRSYAIYALFFSLASRPNFILSKMFSRSLSSFSLVTTTLDGATPSGMDCPLDFSRTRRSTWMMSIQSMSLNLHCLCYAWFFVHFNRYTDVTLPSRPLLEPRTTVTSSSLRMGMDLTLYWARSSWGN